jgi:hypothetical protein
MKIKKTLLQIALQEIFHFFVEQVGYLFMKHRMPHD